MVNALEPAEILLNQKLNIRFYLFCTCH